METASVKISQQKGRRTLNYIKRYWTLYVLLLLPIAFFVVFRYWPMANVLMAFKKFNILDSIWKMPWADNHGFEYFIKAFSNRDFLYALRNTVFLNLLDLVVGFPAPILLALILNELAFKRFKKFTQTVAYMPYFLSWVIVSSLSLQLFATETGLVNGALNRMGFQSVPFLSQSATWVATYILLGVWHSVGWNTIVYLAALTNINPELYEAASVDGAGRLKKIWHITLPGLRPTIVMLLIMNLGRILNSDFDRPFSLRNRLVYRVSDVISIFVYENGIRSMQFSLAAAVGLFQSVVCVFFLLAANRIAEKFGERGIW